MKKGLIVEQKRTCTLMMTADGSFYKARKIEGSIGEELPFEPLESPSLIFDSIIHWFRSLAFMKPAMAAIIALLFIIPFYSWLGEDEVHAYVSIDINPSVELSLNDHYEVIDIVGLNDDGNRLIEQLTDWEGEPVNQVSSKILSLSDQLGYLDHDHQVLFGISYVEQLTNSHDVLQEVSQEMQSAFDSIDVALFEIPSQVRTEAHNQKTSMNLMYASNLLDEMDQQLETSEKEIETNTDRSKQSSKDIDLKNLEVVEKFVEKSNSDQIPPGLKKKVEKYHEKQEQQKEKTKQKPDKQESQKEEKSKNKEKSKKENNNSNETDESDHPSQKNNPPSQKDKSKKDKQKGKQKDQEKKQNHGGPKKDQGNGSPPGLDRKDNLKQPNNKGQNNQKKSNNNEKKGGPKSKGLDKKNDEHPGKKKGNDKDNNKPN